MRLLIFADLHSHPHQQFAMTLPYGRNSRLENILCVLEQMQMFCREKKVNVLFALGDIFHSRTKIDVDTYSSTWLACRELSRSVDRAYFLTGNHDQSSHDGRIHSLEPFRDFATVIDTPIIERFGDISFGAHPFTTDMEAWHKFVAMLPSGLDFFLFHQGISEASIGAYDISVKAEVSYADLPIQKVKWCIGGHYHSHQKLGDSGRVMYVGSPVQHSFGERDERKGWLYFAKGPTHHPYSIEETEAPRFFLFESKKDFMKAIHDDNTFAEWNFVRVKCVEEEAAWIKEHFPRVQVELVQDKQFEENRIDEKAVESDEELLRAYVDKQPHDLDENRLISMGMEFLTGEE